MLQEFIDSIERFQALPKFLHLLFKRRTKKVDQKIVSSFLVTSTAYFNYLQILSKEEMSMKFDEVQKVLNDYKRKAFEEYSELEEKRHEHFKTKSGDGSNLESLKFWATELHQFIAANVSVPAPNPKRHCDKVRKNTAVL
jgi:hypothetical protein